MAQPTATRPTLAAFIDAPELDALIQRARREDLGPHGLDVTSRIFIPDNRLQEATLVARQPGTLAGAALLKPIAHAYDPRIQVTAAAADGDAIDAGQPLARFQGPLRSILSMERVALNFATHLSGIATLTARYAAAAAGTAARIYDTRKTLPGLRAVEKYAVACGGGATHRVGLYDAMLIKDNHLAGIGLDDLEPTLTQAIARARITHRDLKFVEVEVDTLAQLERVLPTGADIVLLDNMGPDELRQAVAIRDRLAPGVELEASGGIGLADVAAIAATGVNRISVGALTHSAPALDLGLDMLD